MGRMEKKDTLQMYLLRKIINPEIFQGRNKRKNYFEGWYYKLIDERMENVLALIPGVSFGKAPGDSHAFIQVLDAIRCKVDYLRFPISCFRFNKNIFEVEIGGNYFSDKEASINVQNGKLSIQGRLLFENRVKYPKSILRPGIMGPFAFVPFMECYHGIVNIHHELTGRLNISGTETDFNKGYGYIEKDWGSSFPEAWIWLQSNHFITGDVSLMFSVAKIPWLGRYFTGFISFILVRDRIFLFATYTKAKILSVSYRNSYLNISLADRHINMEISAMHSKGGVLKAPKNGLMSRDILESITAVVKVKLIANTGETVFEGEGFNTGLEIAGDIFKLL